MISGLDVEKVGIPPCSTFWQFFVLDGKLSCQHYQRSSDTVKSLPQNLLHNALLTIMIAHVCNLEPADYIHCTGDTHIYLSDVNTAKERLARRGQKTRGHVQMKVKVPRQEIDDFKVEDFEFVTTNH